MKLTLYKKLFFSFLVILLLLCIMSMTAIVNMGSMGEKSKQTTQVGLPNVILLGNLNHDLMELDDLILRIQLNIEDRTQSQQLTESMEGEGNAISQSERAKRLFEQIQTKTKALENASSQDQDLSLIKYFKDNWDQYAALFPLLLNAVEKHGPEGLELIKQVNDYVTGCTVAINELTKYNQKYANGWGEELTASYRSGVVWVIALSVMAIAAGLVISFVIARHVSLPIRQMSDVAKRVSAGDLSVAHVPMERQDEIGELSTAFGQMTGHMRQMLVKINEHAELVAASAEQLKISSSEMQSASQQIAHSVKSVSDGAGAQTVSMEETTRSMEEVGTGIGRLAENASTIAETVDSSRQQAESGGALIQNTVEQMGSINDSVTQTDHMIKQLDEKSQQIGSILHSIQDIAQQTNLLALNAAIEAARAGDQGLGFAVVASEVRKLAEQSRLSSEEIASLLSQIQSGIEDSTHAMNKVKEEVVMGIERVRETEINFDHILKSTSHIAFQVQEMAATSQQMSAGAEQITATVFEVAEIARRTSAISKGVVTSAEDQFKATEDVQVSAQSLSDMTEELHLLLSQFKVS